MVAARHFALTLLVGCQAGCSYTFAPPVRGAQHGAPAKLAGGRVEVGGSAGGVTIPTVGGPHVEVGIEDAVSVEIGGNFQATGYGEWAMIWAGARLTRPPESSLDWVGDIELGAGVGAGGADCSGDLLHSSTTCRDPWQLAAGGGYAGAGIGVREDWLTLFGRGRVEFSHASEVGTTLWPSVMLGADFAIDRTVVLGVGGGYLGFVSDRMSRHGWFYQVQVAIQLDWRASAPTPPGAYEPASGGAS